jgi:hypothetical protein
MDAERLSCPSARCQPGAQVLGVVQPDGTVEYLRHAIPVDAQFVQIASRGRSPEQRFRFSDTCAEGACGQWNGERCTVIDNVLAHLPGTTERVSIPRCGIRATCRWYRQNGAEACASCSLVVTEVSHHDEGL